MESSYQSLRKEKLIILGLFPRPQLLIKIGKKNLPHKNFMNSTEAIVKKPRCTRINLKRSPDIVWSYKGTFMREERVDIASDIAGRLYKELSK